jgi:hypothetical protein
METSQNKAPSCYNFLKKGLLLPSRNPRLFTAVCALFLAYTAPLHLANDLAIQPLNDAIQLDIQALNTTEPGSLEYSQLVQEIKNDAKELLLVGAGYLLFAVVVGSAVRIIVLFAAVCTYSDDQGTTTFGALLGQAKARIKGPLLTLAFVYVLEILLYALLLVVTTAAFPIMVLLVKQHSVALLFVALLPIVAAAVCLVYFSFLCSFSVVVAVAEPGCHGAAALSQAWRLVKGTRRQVVMYLSATSVLAIAVSPVHTLANTCAGNSVAIGLLLDFAYALLLALVQLFALCAMTAFYYERREIIHTHQLGATGYAKIPSTDEASA